MSGKTIGVQVGDENLEGVAELADDKQDRIGRMKHEVPGARAGLHLDDLVKV